MVNEPSSSGGGERRERTRDANHGVLGSANLNPFGDLHTLQHLSARLARGMRGVFEPLLRRELRIWAEPLVVQRFTDYRTERPDGLTAWLPLTMRAATQRSPVGQALAVIDGKFLFELLDLFFGGSGQAPVEMPGEFTPAADVLTGRIGTMLAEPLRSAWEPLARIDFAPGHPEANPALLTEFDSEDAVIVTRFGIAAENQKPVFIDLIYPVSALKPFAPSLTGKVHKTAEPDPAWRSGLTRAAMDVRFPIRSVLSESTISLSVLMNLKAGDVIPITVGTDVPVMVGRDQLGTGTVGTSNGKAAIRLNAIRYPEHSQMNNGEMQ